MKNFLYFHDFDIIDNFIRLFHFPFSNNFQEPQIDQCSKEAISLSQHLHNNSIKPKATLTIISIMTATTIILMSLIFE